MAALSALEPKDVFSYFEALCAVPHGSGNTRAATDLCLRFAREHGLRCRSDALGNVVIWKDGSAGYAHSEPMILQGHLDMVCAKGADCAKDMAKEGLDLATDGEYVWAKGTSLGGDDGIAVAMILAILADDSLPHPPIEAVFTVDEETGMDGAFGLDCSDLRGRRLLNLDSEEEGVFTVSCAGGVRLDCRLPAEPYPAEGLRFFTVALSGLLGGHSGVEIDKGRANANHLMGRILYTAAERIPGLRLASVRGGQFDNVICPRCDAVVAVPTEKADDFTGEIRRMEPVLRNEYAGCDAGLSLACAPAEGTSAFSETDTARLLFALFTLPQGVQAMSADFPGLVQTSLNLGVLSSDGCGLRFTCSVRSSIASQKEFLVQRVRATVERAGGAVTPHASYPGWQYARVSPLRDLICESYRDISGREGRVAATHGGLECGLFVEKLPGLDAVSLGPELHDVHSARERLGVASVGRVYRLVCEVLRRAK